MAALRTSKAQVVPIETAHLPLRAADLSSSACRLDTLAMFSKYNSRLAPPVYGWSEGGGRIAKLSDAETVDEALAMWQMPSRPACVLHSPHDPRCTPQ